MRAVFGVALCLLGACGGRAGQDAPTPLVDDGHIDAVVAAREALDRAGALSVGMSVAVFREGRLVWAEGIGFENLETSAPTDPQRTRFRLYSVSKGFTAVALARLVERGLLDPGAPVQAYVPAFPEKQAPISVLQLASHTSGIRHYGPGEAASLRHCAGVSDALPVFSDDPLLHAPGAQESYSSWGFVLLSAVLEAVGRAPYLDVLRGEILRPLHLETIGLDDPLHPMPHRSVPYVEVGGDFLPASPVDNTCKWGAGALSGSTVDVARFGNALFAEDLISAETRELFFRGGARYELQGVGVGGVAFLLLDREHALSIALLSNTAGDRAGPAAQRAAQEIRTAFIDRAPSG